MAAPGPHSLLRAAPQQRKGVGDVSLAEEPKDKVKDELQGRLKVLVDVRPRQGVDDVEVDLEAFEVELTALEHPQDVPRGHLHPGDRGRGEGGGPMS